MNNAGETLKEWGHCPVNKTLPLTTNKECIIPLMTRDITIENTDIKESSLKEHCEYEKGTKKGNELRLARASKWPSLKDFR